MKAKNIYFKQLKINFSWKCVDKWQNSTTTTNGGRKHYEYSCLLKSPAHNTCGTRHSSSWLLVPQCLPKARLISMNIFHQLVACSRWSGLLSAKQKPNKQWITPASRVTPQQPEERREASVNCNRPNQRGNGHGSLKLHWNTPQNNPIPHNSVIGSRHYPASFHLSMGLFFFLLMLSKIMFLNVYKFILINQSHWVFAFASCLLSIVANAVLLKLLIDSSWRATRVTTSQLYLKSLQHLHWLLLQVLFTTEVKNKSEVGAKMSQKWQTSYLIWPLNDISSLGAKMIL